MSTLLTSQHYYVVDENNELIQVSQQFIDKSSILKNYFGDNDKKVFKLFYPKKIINMTIQKVSEGSYDQDRARDNDIINELCEYLNIHITENSKYDELTFKSELHVLGTATYVYNNMFYNMPKYRNLYVEATHIKHIYTIFGVDNRNRADTNERLKDMIPTFGSCLDNIKQYPIKLTRTEFNKKYNIINNRLCEKKTTDTNGKSVQYHYIDEYIVEEDISITYDVGRFINESSPKIQINIAIFEQITQDFVRHANDSFQSGAQCNVIEIYKNYERYIIKFRAIVKRFEQRNH